MPLISAFYGLLVYMYKENNSPHKKPHIHVYYKDKELVIALDGEVLVGKLPRKQQKAVEFWVADKEDELYASWTALTENGEVIKIRGLD